MCVCVCISAAFSLLIIYICIYIYDTGLNRIDTLCLPILSSILSSLCLNRLTSGQNKFRKAPYFPQVFPPMLYINVYDLSLCLLPRRRFESGLKIIGKNMNLFHPKVESKDS